MPLSHVVFRSGFVQDVAAIVRARARGGRAAWWPTCTSPRARCPWTSTAWDVDFATGGSVKWLCGGPGAGYLYVAPRLQRPAAAAGHGLDGARAAVRLRDRRRSTTRRTPPRFLHGTPAVPALYAARAGYEIVRRRSASTAIRAQVACGRCSCSWTWRARARASRRAHPRRSRARGGMVILDVPHGAGGRRASCCGGRSWWTTGPGAGIRFSPHFYTTRRRDRARGRRDAADPGLGRLPRARGARAGLASEPQLAWCGSHRRGSAAGSRARRSPVVVTQLNASDLPRRRPWYGVCKRGARALMAYRQNPQAGRRLHRHRPALGQARAPGARSPRPPSHGIRFRRTDVGVEIPARSSTWRGSTTPRRSAATASRSTPSSTCSPRSTPSGVDDVLVEVDGPEVPIMDGSAAPFVILIHEAGLRPLTAAPPYLKVAAAGGGGARRQVGAPRARPTSSAITYTIGFDHPLLRHQARRVPHHRRSLRRGDRARAHLRLPARGGDAAQERPGPRRQPGERGGDRRDRRPQQQAALRGRVRAPQGPGRDRRPGAAGPSRWSAHLEAVKAGHALHAALAQKLMDTPEAWALVAHPQLPVRATLAVARPRPRPASSSRLRRARHGPRSVRRASPAARDRRPRSLTSTGSAAPGSFELDRATAAARRGPG